MSEQQLEAEAIFANLLTVQVVKLIQQMYTAGKIVDLETYNTLYEAAHKADVHVRKLVDLLGKEGKQWAE